MKTTTLLSVVLGIIFSYSAMAQEDFSIQGKIGNTAMGAKAYLLYTINETVVLDSATLTAGSFTFKGSVPAVTPVRLLVANHLPFGVKNRGMNDAVEYDGLDFYLEKGTIQIEGQKDAVHYAKVIGGSINEENNKLRDLLKQEEDRQKSKPKPKMESVSDLLKILGGDETKKLRLVYLNFVAQHPTSLLALLTLKQLVADYVFQPDLKEIESIFQKLDAKLKASTDGQAIELYIKKLRIRQEEKEAEEEEEGK